jgi:hypothetical protein
MAIGASGAAATGEWISNGAENPCGPLKKEPLKSTPTQSTQKSVASQLMLELPEFRRVSAYGVEKFPLVSVLIWLPFTVVPSQPVDASVGRLPTRPPASAHSMIWRPVGLAEGVGNPVPETVIVWPSVKGPEGMVTDVAAEAVPANGIAIATAVNSDASTATRALLGVLILMAMRSVFLSLPVRGVSPDIHRSISGCRILDTPRPRDTRHNPWWHQDFIPGSRGHRVEVTDASFAPRAMNGSLHTVTMLGRRARCGASHRIASRSRGVHHPFT